MMVTKRSNSFVGGDDVGVAARPDAREFSGEFEVAKQNICHAQTFRAGQPRGDERAAVVER